MKIILEDKDETFIKKINQDLEEAQNPILFCSEKRSYSCSFDVLDIVKANAFIYGITMNSNKEHLEELEELIGTRSTSLNYETDVKLKGLKVMLKDFMEQLNRIQGGGIVEVIKSIVVGGDILMAAIAGWLLWKNVRDVVSLVGFSAMIFPFLSSVGLI